MTEWSKELRLLLPRLKVPSQTQRIWKDECAFSFATPFNPNGLYLNLETFQAFSESYIGVDQDRNGGKLYMKIKFEKIEEEEKDLAQKSQSKKPTKLAIGVEGGFDADLLVDKVVKKYSLVLYPNLDEELQFPFPADLDIPEILTIIVNEVIQRNDAAKESEISAWEAEEVRPVSKFAKDLIQLENGVRISHDPKDWKCQESGMTSNLWLNLSDGYIGSGRQNWDGSGGTGAALRHFNKTGNRFPLCVKLGTITENSAEVYSYDDSENCMVQDPYLQKHLAHFGLDIERLKKTDKTLVEMELDINMKHVFSAIVENDKVLKPIFAPGFVGLINLGNSCYMNSMLQVLFKFEAFQKRFCYGDDDLNRRERSERFFKANDEPHSDIEVQLVKLASALSDPENSNVENFDFQKEFYNNFDFLNSRNFENIEDELAVSPRLLKDCVGRDHVDYKGKDQQDSVEYFRFFLNKLEELDSNITNNSNSSKDNVCPSKCFKFVTEERLECNQSKQVLYKHSSNCILSLSVPINEAKKKELIVAQEAKKSKLNSNEKSKPKTDEIDVEIPLVEFSDCLEYTLGGKESARQVITDYLSPATNKRGIAFQTYYLSSFPKYLCVQMKRYFVSEIDFSPQKLNCEINVPVHLDLSRYRAHGLQENEIPLPNSQDNTPDTGTSGIDMKIVNDLMAMGFDENLCKHAALNNTVVDEALNFVLANLENPVYMVPPEVVDLKHPSSSAKVDTSGSKNNEVQDLLNENDGEGRYKLKGFISHIGKSTGGGHYVCHIFDEKLKCWVLYNDRKVAISENPPFLHGYAYFYERLD